MSQMHPTLPHYGMYNLACTRLVQRQYDAAERSFQVGVVVGVAGGPCAQRPAAAQCRVYAQITLDYMKGNDKMDDMLAARCRRGIEHARRRVVRLRVCASPCQRAAGLTLTRSSCDVVCVVVDLRQRAERMLNWAAARIACQQAGLASLRRRGVRPLVYITVYVFLN